MLLEIMSRRTSAVSEAFRTVAILRLNAALMILRRYCT
jgi:hypothetical protein